MKKIPLLLLVALFGCQPQTTENTSPMEDSGHDALTGAWKMTSLVVMHSETGDTLWAGTRKQYKLYVDGSVMWAYEAEPDSTEWFGYGTYTIDGDTLRETMLTGSQAFRKEMESMGNRFSHALGFSDGMYTQAEQADTIIRREVYERVE